MKKLNQNIRGAGHGGLKTQLRNLLKVHNPDIILLMETRINSNRDQQIIQSLNKTNHVDISPEEFLGDLWLLQFDKATFQFETSILIIDLFIVKYKKNPEMFPSQEPLFMIPSAGSSKTLQKQISSLSKLDNFSC